MQLTSRHWHHASWLHTENVSPKEQYWLTFRDSMTAKLEKLLSQKIHIKVIPASHPHAEAYERQALALPHRTAVYIREVEIYVNDTLWMFARTVIPYSALQGNLRFLRFLGNKPLGAVLFSDPNLERSNFFYTRLNANHGLCNKAVKNIEPAPSALWARYSTFNVKNQALLLTEVFMPVYFK